MPRPTKFFHAKTAILISLFVLPSVVVAEDSLPDLAKKGVERSQITLPGSPAFVLKAKVLEVTNPTNESYKAEIEEYWVAPDKWRRTVKTSSFSQTLIVNGGKTSEQLAGDYYPNWLRTMVEAIFEPGNALQGVDMSRSSDNPVPLGPQVCRRFTYMAGITPVSNKVFSTFCFSNGLLESVGQPGYSVSYKKYKKFTDKHVAHSITEFIESGTEVEATIEELSELKVPDESQFAIKEASVPLRTIQTNEETLRSLAVGAPDIVWPAIRSGSTEGTLSLYVSLDRNGRVREIYELNSSNPGLSDVARDQVMKWTFKTAVSQGYPVQVESILTFSFHTAVGDPIPMLEEEVAKKLVKHRIEPIWPRAFAAMAPMGTPVVVTLGVKEDGECTGVVFLTSDAAHKVFVMKNIPMLVSPLDLAFKQWRFQPYVRDGKATEFQARFTFYVY